MIRTRFDDLVVGPWGARFQGRWFPSAHGAAGIHREKREGDNRSPAGRYRIVACVFRQDRVGVPKLPYPSISADFGRIWSDDPDDPDYNSGQFSFAYPYSHETLRRHDRTYDLVAVLDYNWPDAVPGLGSAIFAHIWRKPRHPTAGCVAFRRRDLMWILARWTPRSHVVIREGGGL